MRSAIFLDEHLFPAAFSFAGGGVRRSCFWVLVVIFNAGIGVIVAATQFSKGF